MARWVFFAARAKTQRLRTLPGRSAAKLSGSEVDQPADQNPEEHLTASIKPHRDDGLRRLRAHQNDGRRPEAQLDGGSSPCEQGANRDGHRELKHHRQPKSVRDQANRDGDDGADDRADNPAADCLGEGRR